jgi:hypothetical protein
MPSVGVGSVPPAEAAGLERRAFLHAASLLVLSLAGCSRVLSHARFARLALNNPHPDEYRPILGSLIRTILPFEDTRFPELRPEALEQRVLALFPLDHDERYLALRRALLIFDELDLFPQLEPPVVLAERAAHAGADTPIDQLAHTDARAYAAFLTASGLSGHGSFTALAPAQRLGYLRLWGQSAFLAKRRFYQSAKGLVMIAAYSTPELWAAIGYAGPLLERHS